MRTGFSGFRGIVEAVAERVRLRVVHAEWRELEGLFHEGEDPLKRCGAEAVIADWRACYLHEPLVEYPNGTKLSRTKLAV